MPSALRASECHMPMRHDDAAKARGAPRSMIRNAPCLRDDAARMCQRIERCRAAMRVVVARHCCRYAVDGARC